MKSDSITAFSLNFMLQTIHFGQWDPYRGWDTSYPIGLDLSCWMSRIPDNYKRYLATQPFRKFLETGWKRYGNTKAIESTRVAFVYDLHAWIVNNLEKVIEEDDEGDCFFKDCKKNETFEWYDD